MAWPIPPARECAVALLNSFGLLLPIGHWAGSSLNPAGDRDTSTAEPPPARTNGKTTGQESKKASRL